MSQSRRRSPLAGSGRTTALWDIPTSVWAYGFFRSAAFVVPYATGTGSFGLGLLIVLVLYVLLIRRSRIAWSVLLVLDVLSFVILLATQSVTGAPWLLHILAGGAIVALLMPSTRAWVSKPRTT